MNILIILIVLLKILIPASMLKIPIFGLWGNYFLDVADGDILLSLGLTDQAYQIIDKSADLLSYIFMLILGLRWSIRKTIIILFVYRFIGQILFFITGNELIFFYFQNFLEPLMMIYALIFLNKNLIKRHFLLTKNTLS